MFLHMCMFLKIKKVKVLTNRSSSLPQKTPLLKRLVSRPTVHSVTLWHHTTSPGSRSPTVLHTKLKATNIWLLFSEGSGTFGIHWQDKWLQQSQVFIRRGSDQQWRKHGHNAVTHIEIRNTEQFSIHLERSIIQSAASVSVVFVTSNMINQRVTLSFWAGLPTFQTWI